MGKFSIHFLLIFLFLIFLNVPTEGQEKRTLIVNIFSFNNGKGLENSRQILKHAIEQLGHVAVEKNPDFSPEGNETHVDINIFFQVAKPVWYSIASYNWFIPNPDYFTQDDSVLDGINLIVCRTHESEKIFKNLNKKTFYLGFTSLDCFRDDIDKNFRHCLHVAGGSPHKGTNSIIKAWKDSVFPLLTVVKFSGIDPLNQPNLQWINKRIPADELRILQNTCGIHLCPSEIEGYGHYIMEGLSSGAVVITTDAPPMNEFVTDDRCLVSYSRTSPRYLGTNYFVDSNKLENKIIKILSLPPSQRKKIGEKNRKVYLQKTQEFHKNLARLLDTVD